MSVCHYIVITSLSIEVSVSVKMQSMMVFFLNVRSVHVKKTAPEAITAWQMLRFSESHWCLINKLIHLCLKF